MEPQKEEQILNEIVKPKSKKIWIIVGILVVVLLIIGGYYFYQYNNKDMKIFNIFKKVDLGKEEQKETEAGDKLEKPYKDILKDFPGITLSELIFVDGSFKNNGKINGKDITTDYSIGLIELSKDYHISIKKEENNYSVFLSGKDDESVENLRVIINSDTGKWENPREFPTLPI